MSVPVSMFLFFVRFSLNSSTRYFPCFLSSRRINSLTSLYVIFCSAFYDNLFKQYNEWEKRKWEITIYKKKDTNTVFDQKAGKKERLAYCTPITIRQIDNGKQQNAIIAHTFPNQSLPNAYERMEEYGKFCFDEWNNAFGTDK